MRFTILSASLFLLFTMASCGSRNASAVSDVLTTEMYTPEYAGGFRILGDSATRV